jgi:hypothetical protein
VLRKTKSLVEEVENILGISRWGAVRLLGAGANSVLTTMLASLGNLIAKVSDDALARKRGCG